MLVVGAMTVLGLVLAVPPSTFSQTRPTAGAPYQPERTPDGKPNLNGIWQAVNTAAWDIQDHSAQEDVPAGQGVVEGNEIPYQPWALAKKKENMAKRATADPVSSCFLPGVPRATYMPFPFEIVQTAAYVTFAYEYKHAYRIAFTDGSPHPQGDIGFWMGDSRGRWEGDTLVVDVTNFTDQTWFDKAGNFHSGALHVTERYTPVSRDHLNYEVTIEDPKVFTRPWKMSMPLYRRIDKNVQLLEYECVPFVEATRLKIR
jgi:hypothetical protein